MKILKNKCLIHFTDKKIGPLKNKAYEQHITLKPSGLWVSVEGGGDGWSDWCKAKQFNLEQLKIAYEIQLVEEPNIIIISSATELDEFHKKYKNTLVSERTLEKLQESEKTVEFDWFIDWSRVAAKYNGIIISPYIWERRYTLSWYYGWDCASGCIWDISAIKEIRRIDVNSKLLSLYPGIRDLTDEEEDELNTLIEEYFDEENKND